MKRFFAAFVVAVLFFCVVAVTPTLAHCGKMKHQQSSNVYIAMVIDDEQILARDLASSAEVDPEEELLFEKDPLEKLLEEQEKEEMAALEAMVKLMINSTP